MLRWPWLSPGPSSAIRWLCRLSAGIVIVHVWTLTYRLRSVVDLGDGAWLWLYLAGVAISFLIYITALEPRAVCPTPAARQDV